MFYEEIHKAQSDREYMAAWRKVNLAREGQDTFITLNNCEAYVSGNPEVFSPDPAMTNATQMLLNIAGDFTGKSVLDVGTGTGIISIVAGKNNARAVLATDIHEPSLTCARYNVEKHDLGNIVTIIKSDMFENVKERFDLIIANLPFGDIYNHLDIDRNSVAYQFFANVRNYINEGGRILVASASFGNVEEVRKLIGEMNLEPIEHKEKKFGVEWSVFEFCM